VPLSGAVDAACDAAWVGPVDGAVEAPGPQAPTINAAASRPPSLVLRESVTRWFLHVPRHRGVAAFLIRCSRFERGVVP